RFDMYVNGYGSNINSSNTSTYPPDSNINESITAAQYLNKSPLLAPTHPGADGRRMVIAPIIAPGTYPAGTDGRILAWGTFFLRSHMFTTNGNCANNPPCGYMSVEYVGKANIGTPSDPSCGTGLTTAVLYK